MEAPCLFSLVGYLRNSSPPDPSPERHAPVYTSPTGGGQNLESGKCTPMQRWGFVFYRNDRISGKRSTDFSGLYLNVGVVLSDGLPSGLQVV